MKKVISLVMVTVMMLSMALIGNAAYASYGKVSVDKIEANVDISDAGYYTVNVNVSGLPTVMGDGFGGYDTMQVEISYDPEKFDAGYVKEETKVVFGQTQVVKTTVLGTKVITLPVYDSSFSPADAWDLSVSNPTPGQIIMLASAGTKGTLVFGDDLGSGVFGTFYLTPKADANGTGKSAIEVTKVDFAGSGESHKNVQSFEAGYIDLGEEVITPSKPETTVVKTFPKRFYADNAITTVGVILEGTDYDNATSVKAGIKSQRDEVNVLKFPSAPIASTTDEDKSFVMVTLGDITEDTVFQPTTATWAYVDLDGDEIEGAPVVENTSDDKEVVDFE